MRVWEANVLCIALGIILYSLHSECDYIVYKVTEVSRASKTSCLETPQAPFKVKLWNPGSVNNTANVWILR